MQTSTQGMVKVYKFKSWVSTNQGNKNPCASNAAALLPQPPAGEFLPPLTSQANKLSVHITAGTSYKGN